MKKLIIIFISVVFFGCATPKIPSEKLSQIQFTPPKANLENDNLKIELKNPVHSPLRVTFESNNQSLNTEFEKLGPIELRAKSDTVISIKNILDIDQNTRFDYNWYFGNTSKTVEQIKLALPFPKGKKYKVVQGNNTNFTHNTDYSRYAVDFDLKINDTICSATNGFVVGVIDKYKYGGKSPKWRDFANYITIYDSISGIYTQYVHLTENGSLVKLGDEVKQGQAIGLCGMTGRTYSEHLHFNCLIPVKDGLKSIPFEFIEGYKSEELKKGDILGH